MTAATADGLPPAASTSNPILAIATKPLRLIPIGLVFAVVYYFLFTFAINRFNIMTPGRAPDEDVGAGYSPKPRLEHSLPTGRLIALPD